MTDLAHKVRSINDRWFNTKFYVDDIVCLRSQPSVIGTIMRTENDDDTSSDESDEGCDQWEDADSGSSSASESESDTGSPFSYSSKPAAFDVEFTSDKVVPDKDQEDGSSFQGTSWHSEDENSVSESDNVPAEPLYEGYVEVMWQSPPVSTDEFTETISAEDIVFLDRSFLCGDIVRLCDVQIGTVAQLQSGTVTAVQMMLDLATSKSLLELRAQQSQVTQKDVVFDSKQYVRISNVPSTDVECFETIFVDSIVAKDGWLGEVQTTAKSVTAHALLYNDGDGSFMISNEPVPGIDLEALPVGERWHGDVVDLVSCFGASSEAVITQTEITGAIVDWKYSAQNTSDMPPHEFSGADIGNQLTRINSYFDYSRFELRDVVKFRRGKVPVTSRFQNHQDIENFTIDEDIAFTVCMSKTTVIVKWQDGSVSTHPSTELYTDPMLDDNVMWPYDLIIDSRKNVDAKRKFGMIEAFNGVDQTVTVCWFAEDGKCGTKRETLSCLDVREFQSWTIGDRLIRANNNNLATDSYGNLVDFNDDGTIQVVWAGVSQPCTVKRKDVTWLSEENDSLYSDLGSVKSFRSQTKAKMEDPVESLASDVEVLNLDTEVLRQFEFVEGDIPDNHQHVRNRATVPTTKFSSRLAKDWELLLTSLTPGIYVESYSIRMDMFRCMMFGPEDTPYADIPFLFDMLLDMSEYPHVAPKVLYHNWCQHLSVSANAKNNDFGSRLNPNLNSNGTVCLSLLDTFAGSSSKNETWSSNFERCNLLRLIISLQSLVLNRDPWYNEAGYYKLQDAVKNDESSQASKDNHWRSETYNATVFVLSIGCLEWLLQPSKSIKDRRQWLVRQLGGRCEIILSQYYFGESNAGLKRVVNRCERVLDESVWETFPVRKLPTGLVKTLDRYLNSLKMLLTV